jgi:hypothetical protein
MQFDTDFLDAQSKVKDPPADDLVASLFEADLAAKSLDLIAQIVQTGSSTHTDFQVRWRAFCESEDVGPIDWETIARAERVFRQWGPQITLSLLFGSLAGGYAASHLAHLLLGVSRLESDPRRRVFETAQLLFDVLGPDGLKPGGRGRKTSERVRLMHAGVRHLMQEHAATQPGHEFRTPNGDLAWDHRWGAFINQELMAGTILTMSVQLLECLAKQGVRLSSEDQWAYVYTWFVAGQLMGVQPQLVPSTLDEARQFWEMTKERQFAYSPPGAELERHLLGAMARLIPLRGLRFIPRAMVWWLNGPEVARMVGLKPLSWNERLGFKAWLVAERSVSWLEVRNRFIRRWLGSAGIKSIQRLDGREMGHQREPFSIPAALAGEWKLPSHGRGTRRAGVRGRRSGTAGTAEDRGR